MDKSIYELICLSGGLDYDTFCDASLHSFGTKTLLASILSHGDVLILGSKDGISCTKLVPWLSDVKEKPVAVAFNGSGTCLITAGEKGSLVIVPLDKVNALLDCDGDSKETHNADVIILKPDINRGKPTSVVWWESIMDKSATAIIGTELGELCFVELPTGREIGGTYINVPIVRLEMCVNNSGDLLFLLITGPDDKQWTLLLENRKTNYAFPLENRKDKISLDANDSLSSSGLGLSRFSDLKEISVKKFNYLKQKLVESRDSYKKKPVMESKGVGTDDVCEEIEKPVANHIKSGDSSFERSPSIDVDIEKIPLVLSNPRKFEFCLENVFGASQYFNSTHFFSAYDKSAGQLSLTEPALDDWKIVNLFKLPCQLEQVLVFGDVFFATSGKKLMILSKQLAQVHSFTGISEELGNETIISEFEFVDEDIIKIFGCPFREEYLLPYETDSETNLPEHPFPTACFVVTTKHIYLCQIRHRLEEVVFRIASEDENIDEAFRLSKAFKIQKELYEAIGDSMLRLRNYASAVKMYKQVDLLFIKWALKFAWLGCIDEFLIYMTKICGPFSLHMKYQRRTCTIAACTRIALLCRPLHQTDHNALLFLSNDTKYDVLMALSVAIMCEQWNIVSYLCRSKFLILEVLHAIFNSKSIDKDDLNSLMQERHRVLSDGLLKCIIDPMLVHVLYFWPTVARSHMALMKKKINSLSEGNLRDLVYSYDPTHPVLQYFFPLSGRSVLLNSIKEEPVSLETLVPNFITMLVKLNQLRGWRYSPRLLDWHPSSVTEERSYSISCQKRDSLVCNSQISAIVVEGLLYTWGSLENPALGRGYGCAMDSVFLTGTNIPLYNDLLNLNTHEKISRDNTQSSLEMGYPITKDSVPFMSCTTVFSVAVGKNHMLAITDNGLFGWGCNKYGQVGIGDIAACRRPVQITSLNDWNLNQVSCGQFHSMAVTSCGRLFTWGWGVYGQLGHGTIEDQHSPLIVDYFLNEKIVSAYGGHSHSVALTKDGIVFTWGNNVYGQCGSPGVFKYKRPIYLGFPGSIVSVTTSFFQNVAVGEDHRVYIWGFHPSLTKSCSNRLLKALKRKAKQRCNYEQKADGESSEESPEEPPEPTRDVECLKHRAVNPANGLPLCREPTEVELPVKYGCVKKVCAGAQHCILLTTHGTVYGWGSNNWGQLGNVTKKSAPHPVQIFTDCPIEDIATGAEVTIAITQFQKLVGAGSNGNFQLGFNVKSHHAFGKKDGSCPKQIFGYPGGNAVSYPSPVEMIDLNTLAEPRQLNNVIRRRVWLGRKTRRTSVVHSEEYDSSVIHEALHIFHSSYSVHRLSEMMREFEAHQALGTLYTIDRQYSKAMHHHLMSLFTQNKTDMANSTTDEALRIVNHYLQLQTGESQSGMKNVLEESIGLWIKQSLPLPQLEDLLLTHLPKTVYPLALLLFKDEPNEESTQCTEEFASLSKDVLNNLSTRFCVNLCSSVITQLQSGDHKAEQLQAAFGTLPSDPNVTVSKDISLIHVAPEQVTALEKKCDRKTKGSKGNAYFFTCGHNFTSSDFKENVLPHLEKSVTAVPGLLGKTARVLLDQYHTSQPQMACPDCVLAHLTIKLTKQPSQQ